MATLTTQCVECGGDVQPSPEAVRNGWQTICTPCDAKVRKLKCLTCAPKRCGCRAEKGEGKARKAKTKGDHA